MSKLVAPHGGGALNSLLAPFEGRAALMERAQSLPAVPLSSREVSDLLMLSMGAYTPLTGFMGYDDWLNVCTNMTTSSGLFWPVPITISCSKDLSNSIKIGDEVRLIDSETNSTLGTLTVEEMYTIDRDLECKNVFRTLDPDHPGVKKILDQPEVNISGEVIALSESHYPKTYQGLYYRPEQTRKIFEEKGWQKVAAFQTRNPMHRSHEFLAKVAAEVCDGVMIHQVLGALKPGDIPADIRVAAIEQLVDNYFKAGSVIQAGYPIEMRYAGPREALLHALFRQNFGCSHIVIGRDHAGVGDYYKPFDAQDIFDELQVDALETKPLKIDVTFYCYECGGMATDQTPCIDISQDERIKIAADIATGIREISLNEHPDGSKLEISGTRLREMLANGEPVPEEFSRPEVIRVLQSYYESLK